MKIKYFLCTVSATALMATGGSAAIINLDGVLTANGAASIGSVTVNSQNAPDLLDYWIFLGNAGDEIVLRADRLTDQTDLVMGLFEGGAVDTNELTSSAAASGSGVSFLDYSDDVNISPLGGPFSDPQINFTLPSTGFYTVVVGEFGSPDPVVGPAYAYEVTLTNTGIAAVPEPSSAALLGLGGLALVFRRRK